MRLTMTKIATAAALAFASTGALAAAQTFEGGNFTMYDPLGAMLGNYNNITGFVDLDAMTWNVASASAFLGENWTASGGTLYGEGTHTISVNGDGSDAPAGSENVTFTVGAGQIGGNINVAWAANSGIDVFNVWDINSAGAHTWVSIDVDGDGILGLGMVDGPMPGFSANFNVTPVPEASTYGMMLAGLGLVGFVAGRRKQAEV